MDFSNSDRIQKRFHDIIPGGSHTYAKGDDQYPEFSLPTSQKEKDAMFGI
jgi:glutamate-1-semialdehyde 2,1-aminomutase